MYKTILVPLDGSGLSEKALPLALQIARRSGAALRLVSVLGPQHRTAHLRQPALPCDEQAKLDLAAWRIRQAAPGMTVETALVEGPIAPTLAEYAAQSHADLIVLTTHGHGVMSRFWLGSVTDELVRRATVPLLIRRPADNDPVELHEELPIRRVIVPLDGTPLAEAALAPALELARMYGATLELFHIVPPLPVVGPEGMIASLPAVDSALLDALVKQGRETLEGTADRLRRDGLTVETRVVVSDVVASSVLDESRPGDVIAVATHARSPAVRWFLGSVADKLIRGAEVPLLVVRPKTQ